MSDSDQQPTNRRRFVRFPVIMLLALLLPFSAQAGPRLPNPEREVAAKPYKLTTLKPYARVEIQLQDVPAAEVYAQTKDSTLSTQSAVSAAQAQISRIEARQQVLLGQLASLNATVLYRVQRVANGVAVEVERSKLAEIAKLPGVKSIHELQRFRPMNSTSVPFIGAPTLWNAAGINKTGAGIKVAVIDTGIDYIHADFGGSGTPALYAANNTAVLGDVQFPTTKVAGGFDFVGDTFTAQGDTPARRTPAPDNDPMDCQGPPQANDDPDLSNAGGHGSHVAGTVAGVGVNADGTPYAGPYSSAIDFTSFKIGPGVAPQASLYALRVFGCEGSSDLLKPAIEYAVDPNKDGNFSDRMDVINMSLGSEGSASFDDQSTASENAAKAGVIVVASAGNSNDAFYITGGPGNSARTLTVAASVDNGLTQTGIRVNSPAEIADVYRAATASFGPPLTATGITGTVVIAQDAADGAGPTTTDGCSALTNAAAIAGNIALVDRGTCNFTVKVKNAQNAGATAVIIANNRAGEPTTPGGDDPTITIPSVMITQSDAALIKNQPAGTVNVTLSSSVPFPRPDLADTIADFSSRGPSHPGSGLKPDIAAPGLSITSARALSGSETQVYNGTSMAAPHVAGSMALLKQLHPDWTVEELKALAMNTATNDIRTAAALDALVFSPSRVGAGRVDLPDAAANNVIAYNSDGSGTVSVSFGNLEVTRTTTLTKSVTVANKGAGTATYNLAYDPRATISGVTYSVTPAQVTVAGGTTANVQVVMRADPALMKHSIDPATTPLQGGNPRHWISEASGYLTMTPVVAVTNFEATILGAYENPPVPASFSGSAVMTYTAATRQLDYAIRFSRPVTLTAGHIHRGLAGENGPVEIPFPGAETPGITGLSGSATLTAAQEALLLSGGLYVNFHTAAFPGGEARGQVVPSAPALRLPVYVTARPASQMRVAQTALSFAGALSATTAISLTGTGLTGTNFPIDEQSVATAFELAYTSPITPVQTGRDPREGKNADLQYVGVASDFRTTATITNPTGVVSTTTVFFGLATHGDWASPHQVQFNIYVDSDMDGTDDYVVTDWTAGNFLGATLNDVFVTAVYSLTADGEFGDLIGGGQFINGLPSQPTSGTPGLNTVLFNTNVMVMPVTAAEIGLKDGTSKFNYRIETYSSDRSDTEFSDDQVIYGPAIDRTPMLTYDAAKPGLDTSNAALLGYPAFFDLPSTTIQARFNIASYAMNKSQGLLVFHHHNASGTRAEVVTVNVGTRLAFPIVGRAE